MKKRKSVLILTLLVMGLLSVGKFQKRASANAGWAVAKACGGGGAVKTVSSAAAGSLGAEGAAWAGAEIGGELGTFLGGPIGTAIGAGVGAL